MMLTVFDTLAALTYLWCAVRQRGNPAPAQDHAWYLLIALAILLQALSFGTSLTMQQNWRLGLDQALPLFLWQCCLIHLLLCLRLPLHHLGRWLWPMAAFGIIAAWFLPQGAPGTTALTTALRLHILLSLLAYASLTLAALQTVSYAMLEASLHRGEHRQGRPPLQVMEDLVFRLVGMGFVLLCASIASGFLFVDDFFAQHLAHKAVFSVIACLLFGGLLAGRLLRGWRGRIAIRWTLSAYVSLVLAYFGTKLVLEQILNRPWS